MLLFLFCKGNFILSLLITFLFYYLPFPGSPQNFAL